MSIILQARPLDKPTSYNPNPAQEVLVDVNAEGKIRPWRDYKLLADRFADYMAEIGETKLAERLSMSGSYLTFGSMALDGQLRHKWLERGNFSGLRIDPLSQWRTSLGMAARLRTCCDEYFERNTTHRAIFLTFTVRNPKFEDLAPTVDRMMKAWRKLIGNNPRVTRVLKTYFRKLEVTYNAEQDTWHPHFHAVVLVPAVYFTRNYISQADWLKYWQNAYGDKKITQVDVRVMKKARGDKPSAADLPALVAEAAKYVFKFSDIESIPTSKRRGEVLLMLHKALYKRKLMATGGELRKIAVALKLGDLDRETYSTRPRLTPQGLEVSEFTRSKKSNNANGEFCDDKLHNIQCTRHLYPVGDISELATFGEHHFEWGKNAKQFNQKRQIVDLSTYDLLKKLDLPTYLETTAPARQAQIEANRLRDVKARDLSKLDWFQRRMAVDYSKACHRNRLVIARSLGQPTIKAAA